MIRRRNKRGQSLLELGILFAIVVGALMAMKTYVGRGLNNRIKMASDRPETYTGSDGVLVSFGGDGQYEPQYNTGNVTTTADSNETKSAINGGNVTVSGNDYNTKSGNEKVSGIVDNAYPVDEGGDGDEDGGEDGGEDEGGEQP